MADDQTALEIDSTPLFHNQEKPFWLDPDALFIAQCLFAGATPFSSDSGLLAYSAEQAPAEGLWIELGVASGKTIRFLATCNPTRKIYGFDSFEGLPENWIRGDMNIVKGTFHQDELPRVPSNVQLIRGWFKDTLPRFASDHPGPIAFLHVDCDIYSSTKESLFALREKIIPGTVIVFDEFYNYPGFELHEFKALTEFLEESSLSAKMLAYNALHEQAALQIIKK